MAKTDYLNMRTTNINVRISPLLKPGLIETGAEMYIMHILTREMSGQKGPCVNCKQLTNKIQKLELELKKFEQLSQPFRDMIGKSTTVNDEIYRIENTYDIFWLMSQSFQTMPS
ncbi:MAG: hypothetical protein AAFZ15_13770 [Bacteroidota bacterium]